VCVCVCVCACVRVCVCVFKCRRDFKYSLGTFVHSFAELLHFLRHERAAAANEDTIMMNPRRQRILRFFTI
jgi:hypothetical protein